MPTSGTDALQSDGPGTRLLALRSTRGRISDPTALTAGYHSALLLASGMLVLGGVVPWLGLHEAGRLTETRRTSTKERDIP